MSQADELLMTLAEGDTETDTVVTVAEPHIVVGSDRRITVPEQLKRIAVQYDHNVETVTFDCPRYCDNGTKDGKQLDMADPDACKVYINYKAGPYIPQAYQAQNVRVDDTDENIMHFEWTISRNVTQTPGAIQFIVCVKKSGETDPETGEVNVVNHWNSELNSDLYVSPGMETEEQAEEIIESDIVQQLLNAKDTAVSSAERAEKAADSADKDAAQTAAIREDMNNTMSKAETLSTEIAVERARVDQLIAGNEDRDGIERLSAPIDIHYPVNDYGARFNATGAVYHNDIVAEVYIDDIWFDGVQTTQMPDSIEIGLDGWLEGLRAPYDTSAGAVNITFNSDQADDAVVVSVYVADDLLLTFDNITGQGEIPDNTHAKLASNGQRIGSYNPIHFMWLLPDPTIGQDPELTDIRVGADGTTYDTAGAAVREQFKAVDSKIDSLDFANPLVGTASGDVIRVDDVSPAEHTVGVKVRSKNLFDMSKIVSDESLINNGNGTITIAANVYGASSGKKLYELCPAVEIGKTYTLTATTQSVLSKYVYLTAAGFTWNFGTAKVMTEEMLYSAVNIYGMHSAEADFGKECVVANIQLELGTEATEYTPYVDPQEVTVTRCGKNLLDVTKAELMVVGASGAERYGIIFDRSGTFTFSCNTAEGIAVKIVTDGAYGDFETLTGDVRYTFTLDDDQYLIIYQGSEGKFFTAGLNNAQIEKGSEATDYEPYKEAETYIPYADGTVPGVKSVAPTMTLFTDTEGVVIDLDYNRDINRIEAAQVEKEIGEISSALDAIIEIQNKLIGG